MEIGTVGSNKLAQVKRMRGSKMVQEAVLIERIFAEQTFKIENILLFPVAVVIVGFLNNLGHQKISRVTI
jgi:hypothetical protein